MVQGALAPCEMNLRKSYECSYFSQRYYPYYPLYDTLFMEATLGGGTEHGMLVVPTTNNPRTSTRRC
jgi:hypothetical protein